MIALALLASALASPQTDATVRARDLGVPFDGTPGAHNAITDVAGVLVGQTTVVHGEGADAARTGATAIRLDPELGNVFAGMHSHNGDGELTGTHYVREKGHLISPIVITNTISVVTAHSAIVKWSLARADVRTVNLPVVGETWDGALNDIYGFHVTEDHVIAALDAAAPGPVAEGNVGGGTGMICHWFKGGIGTASRVLPADEGGWTVGVLVQANHGGRPDLRIAGAPVGREIEGHWPQIRREADGDGSIIVIVATDAPLLPGQLERVARRVPMGLARLGSTTSTWSGDLFLALSTQALDDEDEVSTRVRAIHESHIDGVFAATVQATEEAIVNALVAAETMVGLHGNVVHALPHDQLVESLERHGMLDESPAAPATDED